MKAYSDVILRPMKPVKIAYRDLTLLTNRLPLLATPKIDGIRCFKANGQALSASGKPIPNDYIRSLLEDPGIPDGFDGELVTPGSFQDTCSAIMSRSGQPVFCWRVFDHYDGLRPVGYETRVFRALEYLSRGRWPFVSIVNYEFLSTARAIDDYFCRCLDDERLDGACFRRPNSPYKMGRSTYNEGYLMAMKPFVDSDAVITAWEPLYRNQNPKTVNELGLAERSSARQGLVPDSLLGSLQCRDIHTGQTFSVGSGFTSKERLKLYEERNTLVGRIIRYKYLGVGNADAPRTPIFCGFRDPADLTIKAPTPNEQS